ncbi:MAG TPA: type VI secretion system baseplate subunit TssK [Bryobacteraceae bacterium]|nr:type VI secretion system baseplate subunit TssK [Bryobacteraceae bacterium]
MKSLSKVVWSEGMYVAPHHFQAQQRYFEDFVQFCTANLWSEPYGLAGYQLDAASLRGGTVALVHARGLFPDGLAFQMPEYDALPAPRDISASFPLLVDAVEILLAVPPPQSGGLNCALTEADSAADTRYVGTDATLPDENTGLDPKPVKLGRKNIRFLLSSEDANGLVTLPLARVQRGGSGGFFYDEKFIPPCLQINAAPPLVAVLRRLIELVEQNSSTVIRPKDTNGATASGFSAEGIANIWFLHCLNSSLGPLRHSIAKCSHPQDVFAELARLAGALCTFGLDSHPSILPLYDHTDLTGCFGALDRHIRQHLELIVPSRSVCLPLSQAEPYFYKGRIADERTLGRSRWIFGIRSPIGEADLIESTPRLIKICSNAFVSRLVERALPGLKLTHLSVPPPSISPKVEFQYFAIDKAGACWDHMVKTLGVGVYVPGELPDPEIEISVILES